MLDPNHAIDVFNERFGRHPGRRALHAKGVLCEATFTPSPAAAKLSRAAHFQAPVPALVRISNGGGNPNVPDYAPDVRGLAISFELPDGSRTDILAQTAPRFPVVTPESFLDLVRASDPSPRGFPRFASFLVRNPRTLASLRHNLPALKPPGSYAGCTFFPIHAFRFVDADGGSRFARYTFRPNEEIPAISMGEAKKRGRDYLIDDLHERVGSGGFGYTMSLQIAADGDDVDDPRSVWPAERERVDAGTLEVTGVHPDQSVQDDMVFDPMRLTDGIEASADPILQYRPHAYSASFERRHGG
jgi:catalase